MAKLPYQFDLLHDLKTKDEVINAYKSAVKKVESLQTILHNEIYGCQRNNGLFQTAKDIYGPDTAKELLEIQQEFDIINDLFGPISLLELDSIVPSKPEGEPNE